MYCELCTSAYGPTMVYGLMREVDEMSDIKHLINGTKNKEGYKQAFLDHSHLKPEDLLYVNWGCEDAECQTVITTATGMEITPPPYFLVRHEATKSIVLCIRGTWNIKDFISDFKCEGVSWGSGKAHEGITLIANYILKDAELNQTMKTALETYPDYQVVATGHSLGAGIASLVTLNWRYNKMYKQPCCYAIAPPPILSSSVWDKGIGYIYSFVNEDDVVPRLNVQCIYDMMNVVESCVEEREEQTKENEKEDMQVMLRHERLRKSLREIDHSYKKDDNEHQSFKLKMKSIFGRKIQEITESFKNFENNLKNGKNKSNDETPIFGDFVLPGTIYLLHPYIANGDSYVKYEEMKSQITSVRFNIFPHC